MSVDAEREVDRFCDQQDFYRRMGMDPGVAGRGEDPLCARLADALDRIEELEDVEARADEAERELEAVAKDRDEAEAEGHDLKSEIKRLAAAAVAPKR